MVRFLMLCVLSKIQTVELQFIDNWTEVRSKYDIETLTTSSYSVPLKTQRVKLEEIQPKDAEGDTF